MLWLAFRALRSIDKTSQQSVLGEVGPFFIFLGLALRWLWKSRKLASRLPLGHQAGHLVEQFRPVKLPAVGG